MFVFLNTFIFTTDKKKNRLNETCFKLNVFKDEVEFSSCDCIVKETVWNRPEKVDHLAYKNLCVLQGSGIIKMIRNLAKSW